MKTIKILEVVKLDAERWEVFVDGGQTGMFQTADAAKAAARRKLPSKSPRLQWTLCSEDHWRATA